MRVLYGAFFYDNLWKIAKHLQETQGWEPVYWFGDELKKNQIIEQFPNIVFQDYIKARRAIHTNKLSNYTSPVIDQSLINELSKHQMTAMKIIYRCDTSGTTFTYNDLINHYYLLIKYWLLVLSELKIELVILWTNPHGVEYILYLLCKYLNIPILYLDCAYCITADTHLIAASIEDKSELLEKIYKSKVENLPAPSQKTLSRIKQQQGDYLNGCPDYMNEPELWKQKGQFFKNLFKQFKDLVSIVKRGAFKKVNDHFKFEPGPYEFEFTSGTRFQHYLYKQKLNRNGQIYREMYDKIVTKVDLNESYVYFAAPFQPEGTTLPDADVYDNILLALEIISQNLPKGWYIYYKEHPSIFDSTIGSNLYRDQYFYNKLSKIPSLKCIDYKTDTFSLIDNSKLVASITGSVCWEAVVRGKPAFIFGQVWYKPCDGVFFINSQQDIKLAFNTIIAGYRPNFNEVLKFASVIDKVCVQDLKFRNFQTRQRNIVNLDDELKRYADAFFKAYDDYYSPLRNKNLRVQEPTLN